MHPAAPDGCELICQYLNFDPEQFFSWDNAFKTPQELAQLAGQNPAEHVLRTLRARFDFFSKHKTQK